MHDECESTMGTDSRPHYEREKKVPPIPYRRKKELLTLAVEITDLMMTKAERHEIRLLRRMVDSLISGDSCMID